MFFLELIFSLGRSSQNIFFNFFFQNFCFQKICFPKKISFFFQKLNFRNFREKNLGSKEFGVLRTAPGNSNNCREIRIWIAFRVRPELFRYTSHKPREPQTPTLNCKWRFGRRVRWWLYMCVKIILEMKKWLCGIYSCVKVVSMW